MRVLLSLLLLVATAFGQEEPAQKPVQRPVQGPPPTNLTRLPDGHVSANSEPSNPENFEIRVVVAGDTLSGIAREVLKDGNLWPQLWEQNEHIVNPHWIYPNDKILIRPITRISEAAPPAQAEEAPPPAEEPAEEPSPAPPEPSAPRLVVAPATAPAPPPGPASIFNLTPPRSFPEVKDADLFCSGFIRAAAVPKDMKVVSRYTGRDALLSGTGDYVYVGEGLEEGVRPGSTYQVIRPTRRVSGLGMHYLGVALVQVVVGQSDYSLARVTESCDAVEVGDLLVPYTKADFPALPSNRPFSGTMKASGQIPGNIVMTMGAIENFGSAAFGSHKKLPELGHGSLKSLNRGLVGEGSVVYVDVGQNSGVKPGDLFIVFHDADVKDGNVLVSRETGQKAKTAIGELVILKVEDRASTALVTYSTDAISLGDDVEKR